MLGILNPKKAIPLPSKVDLPSWLAYAYKPILPFLKKTIKIKREGPREYNPADISMR